MKRARQTKPEGKDSQKNNNSPYLPDPFSHTQKNRRRTKERTHLRTQNVRVCVQLCLRANLAGPTSIISPEVFAKVAAARRSTAALRVYETSHANVVS